MIPDKPNECRGEGVSAGAFQSCPKNVSFFRKLTQEDVEGAEAAVALSGSDKGDNIFPVTA